MELKENPKFKKLSNKKINLKELINSVLNSSKDPEKTKDLPLLKLTNKVEKLLENKRCFSCHGEMVGPLNATDKAPYKWNNLKNSTLKWARDGRRKKFNKNKFSTIN